MKHEQMRRQVSDLLKYAAEHGDLDTAIETLLTPQEIEEVLFRWRLMRRLVKGETQRQISHDLGISLGKIARGSRLLKYGPADVRKFVRKYEGNLE